MGKLFQRIKTVLRKNNEPERSNELRPEMKQMHQKNDRKFRLTIVDWLDGVLIMDEMLFSSLMEAKEFCNELKYGKIKIYDHEGRVCHSEHKGHHDHKQETYC